MTHTTDFVTPVVDTGRNEKYLNESTIQDEKYKEKKEKNTNNKRKKTKTKTNTHNRREEDDTKMTRQKAVSEPDKRAPITHQDTV